MMAGGISGWILVDFVAAATKVPMPVSFNIGLLFVGSLVGYTFPV